MATRRPVVLNEANTRLETPQSGDSVLFDEYAQFDDGVTISGGFSSTWDGPALPSYTNTKALIPMDGAIPSYQAYYGMLIEGTSEMTSYIGSYIVGARSDILFRANLADPGYTTLKGGEFQVTRRDRTDIANNNGLWMIGGHFAVDFDANNTTGSGAGKSICITTNNKLENGRIANASAITCQTLLATSNGFISGAAGHRNVNIDELCLSIDSGTIIFGNTQPTNNYVNVANLYHLRLRSITSRVSNVTITNHFGIFQEQANCHNVFQGSVTCNNAVVNMPNLPTSDPLVAGRLWNNSGVLTISAG